MGNIQQDVCFNVPFLCHSQVLITVPLLALLDQFASDFPGFCKVGTGHNKKINFDAKGFLAVTDSVHLLQKIKFHSIFVDEGHHTLPPKMPAATELYRFSDHSHGRARFPIHHGTGN